jgi:hypothetical protein
MPNNGIISRYATVPDEFKVNTTTEFDNTTDTIVVNKALNGIKVEQKAVTLNQLAGMVGGGEAGPQGPIGPQGPAGPTSPAGLVWKGGYSSVTPYEFNDVVTWVNPDTDVLGSYWVTDEAGVEGVDPTNGSGVINEGWAFLASQGPQGIQGPTGPQGIVGPQGPAGTVTLPYKEYIARVVLTSTGTQIFPGYTTLSGSLGGVRNSVGTYQFTFSDGLDFDGQINKYLFDVKLTGSADFFNYRYYTAGPGSVIFQFYKYNPTSFAWELTDPGVVNQATLYYRKYN